MKVSLDNELQQSAAPAESQTALVPRQEQAIAPVTFYNDGDAEGEITRDDVKVPRINIVGKTGALSDAFPKDGGAIVLNKEVVLVAIDVPLNVVAVKIRKFYQEDTAFEDGFGKSAKSLAEVHAHGGQIEDREGPGFWVSAADIDFLIERPEGVSAEASAMFDQEISDKFYTLARMTVSKSAYTAIAKPLFQKKVMTGSVQGIVYGLKSHLRKWEGNSWYGPNLRPAGKTSPEVRDYLQTLNF